MTWLITLLVTTLVAVAWVHPAFNPHGVDKIIIGTWFLLATLAALIPLVN